MKVPRKVLAEAGDWLNVADMHRDDFGDYDENGHELNALRDMADALRPWLPGVDTDRGLR